MVFVAWLLSSCGGSPAAAPQNRAAAQFSDPRLQALWVGAQQAIAYQPIVLNAALVAEGRQTVPETIAPDLRALGVSPQGVTVTPVPDVSPGVIAAPAGASANWCHSYTQGSAVYVAASLEYSAGATGWEMQNVILERLGYDVSGR